MTDSEEQSELKHEESTEETGLTDSNEESESSNSEPNVATADTEESVGTPEFPDLKPTSHSNLHAGDMNRLFDVHVTVAAELGRTNVPIQTLLGLTEGSVFELDRDITSPIELVAQGVPLGNGEVVVVNDSFAIRIKEIYANPS